jgi:hypothetical protein
MAFDYTYHDEETMEKVWSGLEAAGLDEAKMTDAVNCIMNRGIVFREHRPSGPVITNSEPELEEDKPGFLVTYSPPKRFTGHRWAWGRRPR